MLTAPVLRVAQLLRAGDLQLYADAHAHGRRALSHSRRFAFSVDVLYAYLTCGNYDFSYDKSKNLRAPPSPLASRGPRRRAPFFVHRPPPQHPHGDAARDHDGKPFPTLCPPMRTLTSPLFLGSTASPKRRAWASTKPWKSASSGCER